MANTPGITVAPGHADFWRQQVRVRPAMYVGSTDRKGVQHVVEEILANGIDQYLVGRATTIGISVHGELITYFDDGPGLPFDLPGRGGISAAEEYFTKPHWSRTADEHAPHVHLGRLGYGLAIVNALCSHLDVQTWRGGSCWQQKFQAGVPNNPPDTSKNCLQPGTVIHFQLDRTIFPTPVPNRTALRNRLSHIAHLFPGLRVRFGDETFFAPNGLVDLAIKLNAKSSSKATDSSAIVFGVHGIEGDHQIHAAALGTTKGKTRWLSFANGVETEDHGSHVDGFQDALKKIHWKPKIALIHVILHTLAFAGPTRSKLNIPDGRAVVCKFLERELKCRFGQ